MLFQDKAQSFSSTLRSISNFEILATFYVVLPYGEYFR